MSARLKKNIALLNQINKANPKLRKAILENAPKEVIDCIIDCAHNVLQGNVVLTPLQKQRLGKHKKVVRLLGTKGASYKVKRDLVVQKGGFVNALLTPLLIAALPLFTEWLSKL